MLSGLDERTSSLFTFAAQFPKLDVARWNPDLVRGLFWLFRAQQTSAFGTGGVDEVGVRVRHNYIRDYRDNVSRWTTLVCV
jgi:hypothetical protein